MRTIHLKITDGAYDKLMNLLSEFNNNELKIMSDKTVESEYEQSAFDSCLEEPAVAYQRSAPNDMADNETVPKSYLNSELFLANKRYLEKVVERMDAGLSTSYTLEELEKQLDKTLAKYETDN